MRLSFANQHEERCAAELELIGYTVSRCGWPDLLASKGNEVCVVEVKSGREALTVEQHRAMILLGSLGARCSRWDPIRGLTPFDADSEIRNRPRSRAPTGKSSKPRIIALACRWPKCQKPARVKGLCWMHDKRVKRANTKRRSA